jgi:hypothetical protein
MSAPAATNVAKGSRSWQFLSMVVGQLAVGCGALLLPFVVEQVQDATDQGH